VRNTHCPFPAFPLATGRWSIEDGSWRLDADDVGLNLLLRRECARGGCAESWWLLIQKASIESGLLAMADGMARL